MDAISPNALGYPSPNASARPVKARLNGTPCLLVASSDDSVIGRMAFPPMAGERSPLPAKGKRATLEIVHEERVVEPDGADDPLEITVTEANKRTGKFSARFLSISDEQCQLLGELGLPPVPA